MTDKILLVKRRIDSVTGLMSIRIMMVMLVADMASENDTRAIASIN